MPTFHIVHEVGHVQRVRARTFEVSKSREYVEFFEFLEETDGYNNVRRKEVKVALFPFKGIVSIRRVDEEGD